MQIAILCSAEKEELDRIKQHITGIDPGAKFAGTPLELFSLEEGPYRVGTLIENGDSIPAFDNPRVTHDIEDRATEWIRAALMGEYDGPSPLDGDILDNLAINAAVEVLDSMMFDEDPDEGSDMGPEDAEKARRFLSEWGGSDNED